LFLLETSRSIATQRGPLVGMDDRTPHGILLPMHFKSPAPGTADLQIRLAVGRHRPRRHEPSIIFHPALLRSGQGKCSGVSMTVALQRPQAASRAAAPSQTTPTPSPEPLRRSSVGAFVRMWNGPSSQARTMAHLPSPPRSHNRTHTWLPQARGQISQPPKNAPRHTRLSQFHLFQIRFGEAEQVKNQDRESPNPLARSEVVHNPT
jgi:hypothetical protein